LSAEILGEHDVTSCFFTFTLMTNQPDNCTHIMALCVSNSASDCLERLVSKMTYYVLSVT